MEQLNFSIENFEGPLDLLLKLIAGNRMTLLDVKLSLIIDQYLDFIGTIGPSQLEDASEFIEMAARLVYMKSVALLPRQEETEQLHRELVGQLVEYQLAQQAAAKLRYMQEGLFFFVREPMKIDFTEEYKAVHDPQELLTAMKALMTKAIVITEQGQRTFEEIVVAPVVSVSSRMLHILRSLRRGVVRTLNELFSTIKSKGESIATFLGLLELMNNRRILVSDDGTIEHTVRRNIATEDDTSDE
ncbi:MAG: segregation/condensation protein A [Oscillospiraceae bacterium]|nr:segregation/condensation protein A [Oscillospiraceae bacterium]